MSHVPRPMSKVFYEQNSNYDDENLDDRSRDPVALSA